MELLQVLNPQNVIPTLGCLRVKIHERRREWRIYPFSGKMVKRHSLLK